MNPIHNDDDNNDCSPLRRKEERDKEKRISRDRYRKRPPKGRDEEYVDVNASVRPSGSVDKVKQKRRDSVEKRTAESSDKPPRDNDDSEGRPVVKKKSVSTEQLRAAEDRDPASFRPRKKDDNSRNYDESVKNNQNRSAEFDQRRASHERILDRLSELNAAEQTSSNIKEKEAAYDMVKRKKSKGKDRERPRGPKDKEKPSRERDSNNAKMDKEKMKRDRRKKKPVSKEDISKENLNCKETGSNERIRRNDEDGELEEEEKVPSREEATPTKKEAKKKKYRVFKPMNDEKGPDKRVKAHPNIRYEVINITLEIDWDMNIYGGFIDVDAQRRVIFIHEEAEFARENLILGDIIGGVNGKSVGDMDNHSLVASMCEKRVELRVFRRYGAVPLPKDRAKEIKLVRSDGFAYMLIKVKPDKHDLRKMGAFSTFKVKNRVYVHDIENSSIAARHLAVGDALLDLNGTPIPYYSLFFGEEYHKCFAEQGKLSVVVERPITDDTILAVQQVYDALLPNSAAAHKMGADAIKIGAIASRSHHMNRDRIPPRSVLKTVPHRPATRRRNTRTEVITVANRTQEFDVGTDVPEEKEAELRKVPYRYSNNVNQNDKSVGRDDSKSCSRRRKTSRFLTSIMDFF